MENAAKALIIVGTVLLSILIISSAMLLVVTAQETLDTSKSSMADLEIKSFNSQFEVYQGTSKSAEQVLSLLRTVQSSNIKNEQKVAVKLFGLYGVTTKSVYDTTSFAIFDEQRGLLRCSSGNYISESEMINMVDSLKNRNYTYTISVWYCNNRSAKIGNNTHLNASLGKILAIDIERNFRY